jgi:hypothetical protein
MCRSIKTLRRPDGQASDEEIAAAALQYVRKVSGYRAPSRRNTRAFDAAVREVGRASRRLLQEIESEARGPRGQVAAPHAGARGPRGQSPPD